MTPTVTPELARDAMASFAAPLGSPYPFECDNCGHKPTPQEVVDHRGDCAKCGDTIITYTVDAAECILRVMANDKSSSRTPMPWSWANAADQGRRADDSKQS